jgi:hypothetical protein
MWEQCLLLTAGNAGPSAATGTNGGCYQYRQTSLLAQPVQVAALKEQAFVNGYLANGASAFNNPQNKCYG